MIKITENKSNKKHWILTIKKEGCETITRDLNLLQSSLLNKFEIIQSLFKELNKLLPEYSDFIYDLIVSYEESDYDSELIYRNANKFLELADKYINIKDIDFNSFSNPKKATKSSILFSPDDIRSIAIATTALKFSCLFFYDQKYKVSENIKKIIYNKFIKKCKDLKTTDKIFQIVAATNYRSAQSDRYMWDLIKMSCMETPETTISSVFNFFMNNLLVLLDPTQNPVHFLISIVRDNIKWLMSELYKEKILFEENFGASEAVYGTSVSKESFFIFCCNDVISKAASAGLKILEDEYKLNSDEFLNVRDRLDTVHYTDPIMRLFTIPIISKVLEIPYNYLIISPPKNLILISLLIYFLSKNTRLEKYNVLYEFLCCYPEQSNSFVVNSSYKIRDIDKLLENQTPLFGINSRKLKYELLSPICGILSVSKRNLNSILDGSKISKVTYLDLETDAINFYTDFYSNDLEPTFEDIRSKLNKYF